MNVFLIWNSFICRGFTVQKSGSISLPSFFFFLIYFHIIQALLGLSHSINFRISLLSSVKMIAGSLNQIVLALQINLGRVDILIILNLLIQVLIQENYSSPCIQDFSFPQQFSVSESCPFFVKFIPKYLRFVMLLHIEMQLIFVP